MKSLETFDIKSFDAKISEEMKRRAVDALEAGKVLFFPALSFPLSTDELQFLSPDIVDPKSKNISFDIRKDTLGGTLCNSDDAEKLKAMIKRYALSSRSFLETLIPHYQPTLIQAKTSFRPVEIFGRKTSLKKDDTLLHVDSFPSSPTGGQRILRVFTNINQEGKPRVWRTGEPFEDVVKKIAPRASRPLSAAHLLLKLLKITKGLRTDYDHYMLQIHDAMKSDASYQMTVPQEEIQFPANSSWIVYTDQVSHAAMSGQHVLEQTFHLPAKGLYNKETAPLYVLEKFFDKALV
jgi:hypothetical protein